MNVAKFNVTQVDAVKVGLHRVLILYIKSMIRSGKIYSNVIQWISDNRQFYDSQNSTVYIIQYTRRI